MQARAPDEGPSGVRPSESETSGLWPSESEISGLWPSESETGGVWPSESETGGLWPSESETGGVWPSESETGGQRIPQAVGIEERHALTLLRAVVRRHNIHSTKSLVAAYNKTTDKDECAVLLGWLRKYHQRRDDCVMPKAVLEYAELVNIVLRSENEGDILKHLIQDLCSCIAERNFLPPNFAATLYTALVHVDPPVCGGVAELMVVTRKLLGSLSATPILKRNNFSAHRKSFLALQQTHFLFRKSNQSGIGKEEKRELRQAIAAKERALKRSCEYYPVQFHFQALRQAVEHLQARDASCVTKAAIYTCGFCGFAHLFHPCLMLECIDIFPEAVQRASRNAQAAVEDMGVLKRPWFALLWNLKAARVEAAKDEMNLDRFESVYSITMKNQQKMQNGDDLKALRFGIIDELGLLAIEGSSERTRRETTITLSNLVTQQAISEGWIDDDDILIALLDVTHDVYKTGSCNEKTEEALMALHRCCEDSARDAMTVWLDGRSMEEKLRAGSPPATQLEHKDLFIKTRKDVGYTSLTREDLRQTYLRDDFATVMSCRNEPPSG